MLTKLLLNFGTVPKKNKGLSSSSSLQLSEVTQKSSVLIQANLVLPITSNRDLLTTVGADTRAQLVFIFSFFLLISTFLSEAVLLVYREVGASSFGNLSPTELCLYLTNLQ